MSNEEQMTLIKSALDNMIGGTYLYGNHTIRIMDYKINEQRERVYVITDKKEYDRPFESILDWINNLQLVPSRAVVQVPNSGSTLLPEAQVNSSVIKELKEVLLDNIRKIKESKDYIPQAEAIKANVDSVIGLAKTEISYMEAVVRLNKNGF